jgi:hypothetical protein
VLRALELFGATPETLALVCSMPPDRAAYQPSDRSLRDR